MLDVANIRSRTAMQVLAMPKQSDAFIISGLSHNKNLEMQVNAMRAAIQEDLLGLNAQLVAKDAQLHTTWERLLSRITWGISMLHHQASVRAMRRVMQAWR